MGGNQSVPKITAQDRAILDLKLQRDKVKQYQKQIQTVLDREQAIARSLLASGQKDRALTALRRRKYQQSLLSKTDGQLENLEQLVSSIEFSLIEVSVLHGLKQGNDVLKSIHKEMNVESVERLLEETAEARAYQKEIDEMLANNLTLEEEDLVQAELLELQADQVDFTSTMTFQLLIFVQLKAPEQTPQVDQKAADKLPSVPTTELETPQAEEEPAKERIAIPA
ncbi:Vacuolar protein sorting-associated protein 20 [Marasmius tenuissimus]|nr:Vacuolar protein sorting-associated protein 20 [Marasmius tenuissimus]